MIITVRGPRFFSQYDEAAMFEWLAKTGSTVQGIGRDLNITVKRRPGERRTRELIALFRRYKLDMKALEPLKTSATEHLF